MGPDWLEIISTYHNRGHIERDRTTLARRPTLAWRRRWTSRQLIPLAYTASRHSFWRVNTDNAFRNARLSSYRGRTRQAPYSPRKEDDTDTSQGQLEPLHAIFLGFYAASAHDCLATLMHDFSPAKLPSLASAEELYVLVVKDLNSVLSGPRYRRHETNLAPTPKLRLQEHAMFDATTNPEYDDNESFEYSPSEYSCSSQGTRSHDDSDNIVKSADVSIRKAQIVDDRMPPPAMKRLSPLKTPQVQAWRPNFALQGIGPSRLASPNDFPEPGVPTPFSRSISFMDPGPFKCAQVQSPFNDSPIKPPIPRRPPPALPKPKPSNQHHNISRSPCTEPPTDREQSTPPSHNPSTRAAASILSSLSALLEQTNAYLTRIRTMQYHTMTVQAERAAKRAQIQAGVEKRGLPQSRSYWSFSDPRAKDNEKTKAIEQGRARGWKRERFDAGRYRRLADEAMMELGAGLGDEWEGR